MTGGPPSSTPPPPTRFADEIERLEEIVRRLESSDLDLDESLKLFEDGVERLRVVRERLNAAEAKLRQVRGERVDRP
ncbi:MAG TPA: exodeoxyribonuclease VII small subunit [Gemmatimonadales bacterium]|nr:exodeoxyribonuclease VII small subunit [Gemmatimonadales bacterium]